MPSRFLFNLDKEWLKENVDTIFPIGEKYQEYWEAAWAGFLKFNYIYFKTYQILKQHYDFALNLLSPNDPSIKLFYFPIQKYSHHLVILFLNGELSLKSKESLFKRFFEVLNDKKRSMAISYIARNFNEINIYVLFCSKCGKKAAEFQLKRSGNGKISSIIYSSNCTRPVGKEFIGKVFNFLRNGDILKV